MGDTESVPQHDVGVVDGLGAVADPLGQTARGLARGLRDVPAGGPELVVAICFDGSMSVEGLLKKRGERRKGRKGQKGKM